MSNNIYSLSINGKDFNMANKLKKTTATKYKILIFPVIIILIEILFNFIIIPKIYGNAVLPYDWLFADPQSIINTISNFNNINLDTKEIMFIRIFEYTLLLLFFASIFFVGKKLNVPPKSNDIRKYLYLMTQDVINILNIKKESIETKEFNIIIADIKQLEERLSIESDFGYGNNIVINCENDIVKHIESIIYLAANIEEKNYTNNIDLIRVEILIINRLLSKRAELKKI